eukprot:CCRYP_013649-RA/>CCRYP_013649-RA protein AED:0.07 eAED:0.07 QI:0/1/0.66/1/0.5/0.33/3/1293/782
MEHHYEIGRVLGRGSFATVHLARCKQKRVYALKLVDLSVRSSSSQRSPPNGPDADSNDTLLQLLRREVSIHSTSHHANVVQFIESFSYTATDHVAKSERRMMAMVLEYCSGGDLSDYFTKVRDRRRRSRVANSSSVRSSSLLCSEGTFLPYDEIKHAASDILSGLSYFHSKGIVHRDIKAGNIYLVPLSQHQQQQQQLHNASVGASDGKAATTNDTETELPPLTSYTLKIGDFGLAVRMDDDEDWCECRTTVCGTPSCLAPEVARGAMANENSVPSIVNSESLPQGDNSHPWMGYGQPADLWATGCLLYTMIVGRNPFALPSCHNSTSKNSSENTNDDKDCNHHELKMARVAATIDRVAREDWALPAHVNISANMEGLLNQLLESRPRKRGTARGILAFHPFFTDSSTRLVATWERNLSLEEEVCVEEKENCNQYNIASHKHVSQSNVDKSSNDQQTTTNVHNDLTPMEGLQRLPPFKYEWKEENAQFAVFLLGRYGLVIHEERNGNGRWLHVSGDGKGVLSGNLVPKQGTIDMAKSRDPTSHNRDHLYHEAFRCAAPTFKCPGQSKDMNFHTQYQSLDALLHPAKKRDLRLYKSAERLVQSVKSSTPKIIVYLYSPKTSLHCEKVEESCNRMFAKVTLMENGPRADVEAAFVEGTTFQLRETTQKRGKMIVQWEHDLIPKESAFDFDSDIIWNSDLVDLVKGLNSPDIFTMAQKLSHHFRVVQSAFEECFRLEQSQLGKKSDDEKMYPISIKFVAGGWDRRQWVVIDDSAATPVGLLPSEY